MVNEKEETVGAMAQNIEQLAGGNKYHFTANKYHFTANKFPEPFDQLNSAAQSIRPVDMNLLAGMQEMKIDKEREEIASNAEQLREAFIKCYTRYPHNALHMLHCCPVGLAGELTDHQNSTVIFKEEFQQAKLAAQQQQMLNEQLDDQACPAQFAREFNGIRTCPMMDFDDKAHFLQYKQQYMENIRELVTEEEIKEWESVEKGWEKYRVGTYGYYGDFEAINSENDQQPYSREQAIYLYKLGDNMSAIKEFRKAGIADLDAEAVICYYGALAGENYLSDLAEIISNRQDFVSQFFQLYCDKKYKECVRVCDSMISNKDELQKYYFNMKANAQSKMEQYELALEQIMQAVSLDESIPKFQTNKAILMMKCGRSKKEFMEPLEKALSMLPEHLKPVLLEIEHILNHP